MYYHGLKVHGQMSMTDASLEIKHIATKQSEITKRVNGTRVW